MSCHRTLSVRRTLNSLVLVFLCSACASTRIKEPEIPPAKDVEMEAPPAREIPKAVVPVQLDKAQQELASGIASYENGNYKLAARQLQTALALGLEAPEEQARAHKFLAFMHCVGRRERLCREEFRKALVAYPAFDLTLAEAGHPTWGPLFRKLRAAGKPAAK